PSTRRTEGRGRARCARSWLFTTSVRSERSAKRLSCRPPTRLIRRLSFRLKTTCGARSPEPSLLRHLVVVVQTDNLRGVAGQPKDVQPGVSAVDDVDEPAVVG